MRRTRNDGDREHQRLPYRSARVALYKAIKLSKKACLVDLCHKANENPWDSTYKVAMIKIKGPAVRPDRCPEKMKVIIEALCISDVVNCRLMSATKDFIIRSVAPCWDIASGQSLIITNTNGDTST